MGEGGPVSCVSVPFAESVSLDGGPNEDVKALKAAEQLLKLGVSLANVEKGIQSFDPNGKGTVDLAQFVQGCLDLAENQLDHDLWRLFVMASEDHRGIMLMDEVKKQVTEATSRSVSDVEVCWTLNYVRQLFDSGVGMSQILQDAELEHGANEVTFEVLKDFVASRHNEDCVLRSSSLKAQGCTRLPRLSEAASEWSCDDHERFGYC